MPNSPTPGNDEDLSAAVHAAQNGDEDAFRLLYRAIHPGLIRYMWAHAGDVAEDLAAETWLCVARDIGRFRGDAAGFRGWVTSIGRHRVLDYLRQRGRRPSTGPPVELLTDIAADDDTEGAALEAVATAGALEMISGLPPIQAEAVLLTVVMQLDGKTAGQVMGKRAGAVRVAAHRGLRRLAEQLRASDESAGDTGDTAGHTADDTAEAGRLPFRRVSQQPQKQSRRRVTTSPGATVKGVR